MMDVIFEAHSCAEGSKALIRLLDGEGVYGVYIKDDDGDAYLIAIDPPTMDALAGAIIRHMWQKEKQDLERIRREEGRI